MTAPVEKRGRKGAPLIIVDVFRTRASCEEFAARVTAVDGDGLRVEGPEPGLVDGDQLVVSLRTGRAIMCADDPEEWVRGLVASFRSPYLAALVVEDTNPLPDVEVARTTVRPSLINPEPLDDAALAGLASKV